MHRSGLIDTPFETAFCSCASFRERTADSNSRNALITADNRRFAPDVMCQGGRNFIAEKRGR
jgi:hypothetical protein